MTNLSQQVFDTTASTYDADRSRLIPGCDAFYHWAVDLIPSRAKIIVDLGAGSGLLSLLVRNQFPQAHLHLMDFSGPMLELARARLGNATNVTFQQANYVTEPLPEQVCAFVSSLSIHHVEDTEKRTLFRKVFAALKPGGVFINADQVSGPTAALEERYKALWLQQVRANGATEQQIADSLYRQQEDRCAPVADQLAWLNEAGFVDVDCWYKDNRFAVLSATKPA